MADMNPTQDEADALIAMEKHRVKENRYDLPMGGQSLVLSLQSPDKREQFLLDVSRGRIDLLKGTMQNRARQVVVRVRAVLQHHQTAPHRARALLMITEIQKLVDDYVAWLKDRIRPSVRFRDSQISPPARENHSNHQSAQPRQSSGRGLCVG